ncbi:MAG: peptide chain release factor N(5)-glutamine methyltransferase [Kiritimatiellia bacterium]
MKKNSKPESVRDLLRETESLLTEHGDEEARRKTELLVSHLCGCRPLQIYTRLEDPVFPALRRAVELGRERLLKNEPLQYIIGETDFFNCTLKVDPRVLVPRPETEELVQLVLETAELWKISLPVIADVGTGSGCIPIALCKERPRGRYIGIDLHADALALAKENAALNGSGDAIQWRQNDLLAGFPPESLDAVTANLPYIPSSECAKLPPHIREFEPLTALDGGADGLDAIRRLVPQAEAVLKSPGWIFLEIGAEQGQDVTALLEQHGFENVTVKKDLAGLDRIATGRKT